MRGKLLATIVKRTSPNDDPTLPPAVLFDLDLEVLMVMDPQRGTELGLGYDLNVPLPGQMLV